MIYHMIFSENKFIYSYSIIMYNTRTSNFQCKLKAEALKQTTNKQNKILKIKVIG